MKTFKTVLQRAQQDNPGIFSRPELYWILDETKVTAEFGGKTKVFGPANTSHGGFRATQAVPGTGKHLTAIIVASAAGHVLPPFFVFAGVNQMQRWFEPLHPEIFKDEIRTPHWLTRDDWFPGDSSVVPSPNGSMEKHLLPLLIENVNTHARKYVPQDQKIVLTLDGHSSRNGWDWLEACVKKNIVVLQSPANTSHFLQPCDQYINKHYQGTVRATVDYFWKFAVLDFTNMGMKLKLGIAGYCSLTPAVVRQSFEKTGLWPMDFRFLKHVEQNKSTPDGNAEFGCVMRPKNVKRRADVQTWREIQRIGINSQESPVSGIQKVSAVLQQNETMSSILNQFMIDNRPDGACKKTSRGYIMDRLSAGAPAIYLTHSELIKKRKEHQMADETARAEREVSKKRKEEQKRAKQAFRKAEENRKRQERESKREISRKRKAEAAAAKGKKKRAKGSGSMVAEAESPTRTPKK